MKLFELTEQKKQENYLYQIKTDLDFLARYVEQEKRRAERIPIEDDKEHTELIRELHENIRSTLNQMTEAMKTGWC